MVCPQQTYFKLSKNIPSSRHVTQKKVDLSNFQIKMSSQILEIENKTKFYSSQSAMKLFSALKYTKIQ